MLCLFTEPFRGLFERTSRRRRNSIRGEPRRQHNVEGSQGRSGTGCLDWLTVSVIRLRRIRGRSPLTKPLSRSTVWSWLCAAIDIETKLILGFGCSVDTLLIRWLRFCMDSARNMILQIDRSHTLWVGNLGRVYANGLSSSGTTTISRDRINRSIDERQSTRG